MSSILDDQQRPRIEAQLRGGVWGLRSQTMSIEYSCAHGAQVQKMHETYWVFYSARIYRPCFRENQPKRSFSIK